MAKMKMSMILLGAIILVIISVVSTYLVLLLTHVIPNDPIKIEITIQDKEKSYDGTPLTADSYEITSGDLLNGHYIELNYIGSITNAGIAKSSAEVRAYDENHTDHTKEYEFTIKEGNLIVKKRSLELAVTSDNRSTDTNGASYEITSGSVCTGHKIDPIYTFGQKDENNKIKTSLKAYIFDTNGLDVTDNYNLSYVDGSIDFIKTKIIFRTLSKTKVYDGKEFSPDELETTITYGQLPTGYSYDVTYDYPKKADVTTSELSIVGVTIYNQNHENVTDTEFEYEFQNLGQLTITPKTIKIEAKSYKGEYDGSAKTCEEFTILGGDNIESISGYSFDYLDNSYQVSIDSRSIPELEDVGTIINNLDYIISDKNTSKNVTSNFTIDKVSGIIEVTKKKLTFTGTSSSHEYNPEYKIDEDSEISFNSSDSDYELQVEEYNYSKIVDAGTYNIYPVDFSLKDMDVDINNYEINIIPAQLTITKKVIIFSPNKDSLSYVFNGTNKVPTDDTITWSQNTSESIALINIGYNINEAIDAGVYNIVPVYYELTSDLLNINNYDISFKNVILTIFKEQVTITVANAAIEVDDSIPNKIKKPTVSGSLFSSNFNVYANTQGIETEYVGSYIVSAYYTAKGSGSGINLNNYDITIVPGTLVVSQP